ncbi:MAG: hypothetical protein HY360_03825 [Verrucomicrobia bacterium]|nr:hypothetical protein [Verrucomicrobiota bacterium]
MECRGAALVFLAQSRVGEITSAWLLTGDPLKVTPEWSDQTITAVPDPARWTCLGSRHDRSDTYGCADLRAVLRDVNCDIMFILFPLDVTPMGLIEGDPHRLRPEKDYPVWRSRLPEGYVSMDTVRMEFPSQG